VPCTGNDTPAGIMTSAISCSHLLAALFPFRRLFQMDNSSIQDHMDKIRRVLCDKGKSFYLYNENDCSNIVRVMMHRSFCDGRLADTNARHDRRGPSAL
jgi:hypothetical protein